MISKNNPSLLMPLYHDAVEFSISNRNRDSYKKAVKYLKKLRTIYKKEKMMDFWDTYLENLLLKTKRLRAFHEECKRGKLIDA
jgi:uncharacterized Zn finger protein